MTQAGADGAGLTETLVRESLALSWPDVPPDVRRVARDCLAEGWRALAALAMAVATVAVAAAADEEGGHARASFVGRASRGSVLQAAVVNGTASHALDYDDVNLSVPGHLSVAILPAVLALAEQRGERGTAALAAFTAGYEFACRVGRLVEPAHYANGFHATATIGSLGAAVACARLLALDASTACHAVGLAATQAAGMKAMFGTMTKPLHAGLAAQAGVRAALLAARGFTSRTDAIECRQGFAALHGRDFRVDEALAPPADGFHILANLFKFHAACYSTHATIEALATLRRTEDLRPDDVESIRVTAGEGCTICNISTPSTALEAKFSLRAVAAFALLGIDTSGLRTWDRVTDPEVMAVRDKVTVELVPGMGLSDAEVLVQLRDGTRLSRHHDCGVPLADKREQSARVFGKFRALAFPVIGTARGEAVLAMLDLLEPAGRPDDGWDTAALVGLCTPAPAD